MLQVKLQYNEVLKSCVQKSYSGNEVNIESLGTATIAAAYNIPFPDSSGFNERSLP